MTEDSFRYGAVVGGGSSTALNPLRATAFAYGFVLRHFWQLAKASCVPLLLASACLYVSLRAYLALGLYYLQTGDNRAASLGLLCIGAGLLPAVFFYGVAVAKSAEISLDASGAAPRLRNRPRLYWRVFTAYTRLLLCSLVIVTAATVVAHNVGRLVPSPLVVGAISLAAVIALLWLFLRAGFLLPAIASAEQGSILRRSWSLTAHDTVAVGISVVLLALPGAALEVIGEALLRAFVGGASSASLFDHIRALGQVLIWFVLLLSSAAFLNIALLTAGSVYAYRLLAPDMRR